MALVTQASEDKIRDVFIFVEDSCELTITPVPAEPVAGAAGERQSHRGTQSRSRFARPTGRRERSKRSRRTPDDGPLTSRIALRACGCRQRGWTSWSDLVGEMVTVAGAVERDCGAVGGMARCWRFPRRSSG